MKNLNLMIEYFAAEAKQSFCETVQAIIDQVNEGQRTPIRFVFFGIPQNNEEYSKEFSLIKERIRTKFGKHMPVVSYVAQKPLCNNALVLEAHWSVVTADKDVHHKQVDGVDYLTVEDEISKKLSLGGITSVNNQYSIFDQSVEIFEKIKKIFELEKMPVDSIVRQWNYIADITKVVDGKQHYQEFNNARSQFYGLTSWPKGYPAATGIGTYTGGVVVEVFAVKPKSHRVEIVPLDNKLQVPPHAYSQEVLVGDKDSAKKSCTTPKFERGKVLYIKPEALVYISGTAAIRGEESLDGVGAGRQTIATLENINYLRSPENLRNAGVKCEIAPGMKSLRVYLKESSYYEEVKQVVDSMMPDVPSVYLLGDICRDNLLIEIEGIATNF